ncbi:MAG: FAD-dependent oxidoreductase, partial [Clostridia bacterium]
MQITWNIEPVASYDVCVCGGGPAGFCAAVAAARNGARTVLLEHYGVLGGAMTVGGVPAPALFHAHGKQIISGIGWELMVHLAQNGDALLPQSPFLGAHPQLAVRVNALKAAAAMDDFCLQAGVALRFHHTVAHVVCQGGHIDALLIAEKAGLSALQAKIYVDCTGDGDVAAFAGAPFALSSSLQPGSFNVTLAGFDPHAIDRAQADALFQQANLDGRLCQEDVWGGRGTHCGSLWNGMGSNLNHVYPLNGADSDSRSEAEIRARKSVARLVDWLRTDVPGCEKAYVAAAAPASWARESRRIEGRKTITGADYLAGVVPPDAICASYYPIDIHTHGEDALINRFHAAGRVPGIPYGALVPCTLHNLLVAGRCISGDREAQSAYRVQASCMAMGEAAGTAAA